MALGQAIAFVVVATAVVALGVVALAMLGLARLESSIGILRDGLAAGTRAPRWRLRAVSGREVGSPSGMTPQLVLCADHSLREFPDVVAALQELRGEWPELEILLVAARGADVVELAVGALGLDGAVEAVAADERLYQAFNVRVMPFGHFLSPSGDVLVAGLVNRAEQLVHLSKVARDRAPAEEALPLEEAEAWR
jgi:hypothetical protein